MRIPFEKMFAELERVLVKKGFEKNRAELCARLFTEASCDGVYSHGLNRFPRFMEYIEKGYVDIHARPEKIEQFCDRIVDEVIDNLHAATPVSKDGKTYYPGERTLLTRRDNLEKGIPVERAFFDEDKSTYFRFCFTCPTRFKLLEMLCTFQNVL